MTGDTRPGCRPPAARVRDTLALLGREVDCWVATCDPATGAPHLVPLSFVWDGATLLLATTERSVAGRGLAAGRVRTGLGATRDVVMVDGRVAAVHTADLDRAEAERFARRTGFDPRASTGSYLFFRVSPSRVQAWREEDELDGREIMRHGRWVVDEI
ncbi:pyridoxamine 5'-phosphate oxidase family protein [Terrabacter sp. NPDC000476]|uniref:pyridoxamine 5'-phosphate oxidase family protein n=1 Tax=Terrabacter sp. NPDC000476 TaxID=3154258 RepID=UPI00332B39B4